METLIMKPQEVKETVITIAKAESVKELDNPDFKRKIERLRNTTFKCLYEEIDKNEELAIRDAFQKGDPVAALKNLISLRKGKHTASGQNSSSGFALENKTSNIAWVYCYFIRSLASMAADNYAQVLYENKCIEIILEEVISKEFLKNKDQPCKESPTTTAIIFHLTLLFNITGSQQFLGKLGEEMRNIGLFGKLKEYVKSKYKIKINLIYS